jgi:signal transduction histidine kinase
MRGFRRTLFLSHIGLVALALVLLAVTLRGLVTRYFAEQLRDRLITQAAYVRRTVAPLMHEDGFEPWLTPEGRGELQRDLKEYASRNGIRLRVVSLDTQVLLDTAPDEDDTSTHGVEVLFNQKEVRAALGGETNSIIRGNLRDQSSTMYLAMPAKRDGIVVGCVLATAPVLLLTPAVKNFVSNLAIVMGGILVLTITLSGVLAQRLSLPARRLEEATRQLAAGDLSARVLMHKRFIGRGDEMDRLTREWNAMAERLEAVDEERRAFLADVSHELRTPLCAIKGSAETLRDGAWQNPKMAPKFAGTIVEQSDRLIRLVGDLLKLARLENQLRDSKTVASTHIDAQSVCERALSAVRPLFEAGGVHTRFDCTLKELRGDGDLIEQLLINLLANAARHSPPGSTTTLQATHHGHNALLRVLDEGCGIAAEHLPKLGQRFYRVEEGRERTASTSVGSGLGLAICRRIALAHGGTLHIESEVGRGTTVSVLLPDYTT